MLLISLKWPDYIFLVTQAAQLTHMVEGQLKDAQEEVNKEKALKQVAEASLNETPGDECHKVACNDRRESTRAC